MERDSCVFYRSFYEAIDDLEDADKLACYNAIFKYALNGEEPTEKGIVSTVFKLVRPLIDRNNESYKNGLKGGRPKTEPEPNENPTETQPEPLDNPNEDVDVNVNEDVDVEKRERAAKRPAFVRPTAEEVRAYCRERNNQVDPEEFVDFYASKGWKVGNQAMKDWKAAVRTWEKKDKPKARQPSFSNQRSYNYDELERRLLAR